MIAELFSTKIKEDCEDKLNDSHNLIKKDNLKAVTDMLCSKYCNKHGHCELGK